MLENKNRIVSSIKELKKLGKLLIPYNYPKTKSEEYEDDLLIFKSRKFIIDGYSVIAHYQRCDYEHCLLDVLQLYGDYSTFLPINVNCKLARMFLGDNELSLIETYKHMKRIYCWTVYMDRDESVILCPTENDGKQTIRSHNGFSYKYISSEMTFFI